MDGGRRLLRSLTEAGAIAPAPYAFAGVAGEISVGRRGAAAPQVRSLEAWSRRQRFFGWLAKPGVGAFFAFALIGAVGAYGLVRGGQYDAFVAEQGRLPDVLAKAAGFSIKAVTIAGERELTESEILSAAGIGPRNSLLLLDADQVRDRLKTLPLVKEVSVTKLYPNRLLIEVEERQPFALWQKDGQVQVVAADGIPIDDMRDDRFARLPLVVGAGANEKLADYLQLVDAAGDLRSRIRAGMFVAERRWTLKLTNGVEIELPENNPTAALERLGQMQRDYRVLDKDILSLDLREPGRMVVRLGDNAASARAELLARKIKPKGGQT